MMSEEKARKVLDNLVRDIAVSTKRSEALSQLTNKELAEKLISDVWGISKLFGEKSDLLTEAIERLFVLDTPERVYCTADGEYPLKGEMVIFEIEGDDAWIGGCESYDLDCGSFWFGSDDIETDFHPITEPIYWKPLTGLKEQYERERK